MAWTPWFPNLVTVCASCLAFEVEASRRIVELFRVRPAGSYAGQILEDGRCRSETMRTIVERLERSNVIVYIEQRRFDTRMLSGGIQFVAATRTDRILRVLLNVSVERARVIAVLAHELQHAIEVSERAEIVDSVSFARFYRDHGVRTERAETFDTESATRIERAVEKELTRGHCPHP